MLHDVVNTYNWFLYFLYELCFSNKLLFLSCPWLDTPCFNCIFSNEKFCISIQISLTFGPKGPIDNREVLLHVKRERVRVTSDSWSQIRYTSRSRTLLGFATRRDVSADKQAHRCQQMTRQQSIKHIRKQMWTKTA